MHAYRSLFVTLFIILLAVLAPVALAAGPYTEAALGTLAWAAAQQQADGSFPGFGVGSTADAIFAICATGGDPNGFLVGDNSPISYLAANIQDLTANTGNVAKTILAVVCAGKDPRAFAGVDLVATLEGALDADSGQYGTDLTGHTFAMLALAATGRPLPDDAATWLRQAQTPEGGWSWSGDPSSGGADTNSTALAMQALVAAGLSTDDPALEHAVAYLHTQQNEDGGFPYAKPSTWGSDTDANSTAYVIQGLLAAGQDPEGPAWTVYGNTPLSALLALQLPSGGVQWQAAIPGENALATYQAAPAFMLKAFPLASTTVGLPALLPDTGVLGLPVSLAALALLMLGAGFALRQQRARS